ncbi:MAG TPA: hypothetical protein VNA26_04930 [Chitinophagaceae bacterium]|nr:hypothetical protein [Chitinophagaceae bacterium]
METQTQIQAIEHYLNGLLADNPSHFLVDLWIKPTNNVKVFIDADEGIPLSVLIKYNRSLYKIVEESGVLPADDFSLEVSSPGLDEPLKIKRQYKKNIGRFVDVLMKDTTKKEGRLLEVTDEGIKIEIEKGKGKKKEIMEESILFEHIKNTKIQIKF